MRSRALVAVLSILVAPHVSRAAALVGGETVYVVREGDTLARIGGLLGADWPETVYRLRSHGCIRVHAAHMKPFFEDVEPGTPGEIIYEPVKAAVAEGGKVYLEVHRDVYGKAGDPAAAARTRIESLGVPERVDWGKVAEVVKRKSGRAENVTR